METIKSSAEISQLFATGRRFGTPYLTLIVGSEEADSKSNDERHGHSGRVAFIAGKKLGNAVWRNRAKRRLRALCRDLGVPWADRDVVFLAKSSLCQVSYSKVLKVCGSAVERACRGDERRA